jgi:nucleotide-binding universal stress UspA family protein
VLKLVGIRPRRPSRDLEAASILVPVTGDPSDDQVIELACELLDSGNGTLYVLYVIEVERAFPVDAEIAPAIAKGEEILEHIEEVARKYKCDPEAELVQARHAGSAVVQEAADRNVGKIVVGCPSEERFGSFSLGDTIPYILKNAPCSVIVWRDPIERPDNGSDRVGLDGERRSG